MEKLKNHELVPTHEFREILYDEKPVLGRDGKAVQGLHQVWISLNNPKQLNSYTTAAVRDSADKVADAVKVNIYVTDLANFARVNDAMAQVFSPPYPARATVQVAALPRGALVEVDAVLVLE